MTDSNHEERIKARRGIALRLVFATMVVGLFLTVPVSGLAAADNHTVEDKAPYYVEWGEHDVENETWMQGNEDATIENSTTMATRLMTFVVGDDGEGGTTTSMISGMLVTGMVLGFAVSSGVGLMAGGVFAVTVLYGIAAVGLSPEWLYPTALFLVGILLSAVIKRQIR